MQDFSRDSFIPSPLKGQFSPHHFWDSFILTPLQGQFYPLTTLGTVFPSPLKEQFFPLITQGTVLSPRHSGDSFIRSPLQAAVLQLLWHFLSSGSKIGAVSRQVWVLCCNRVEFLSWYMGYLCGNWKLLIAITFLKVILLGKVSFITLDLHSKFEQ